MITSRSEIEISKSPDDVFAFLDDLGKTPLWNSRCIELKRTSSGDRGVGAKLQYRYKESGREGKMSGEVTAYDRPNHLAMRFVDKLVAVDVVFELSATSNGTHLVHSTNIEPLSMFTKIMAPLIRASAQKEIEAAVVKIRELLEA